MSRYSKTVACTCRLFPPPGFAAGVEGRSTRGHSQGLDGPQGGEGALGETLDLVVVQGEKREVLQVLEGIGPDAVDRSRLESSLNLIFLLCKMSMLLSTLKDYIKN